LSPGINLGLSEQSEVWANLRGGRHAGTSYNGLTTASLDVDLEKALGWHGGHFYVSAFDIHGHGPTPALVGSLQAISSIEAAPSVKLYDLWIEQGFPGGLNLRLGQEGADDEMMTTDYGALYLQSAFGFPSLTAVDLPSGGPAYPLAAPFVRAQAEAGKEWTVVGAVYGGDPAPPGPGDPQIRDRNGTAFRLDDHALIIGELRYAPAAGAPEQLPTTYKFGFWYHSGHFADQRRDNAGMPLASPAGSAVPRDDVGDYAFYGVADQVLWHRPGKPGQGIGAFLRVMAGPGDRNLANLMVQGGVNWRAPLASRPDDQAGLAVSYLGISPAARAFSRDLVRFGGAARPFDDSETVIEATYQAQVTNWLTLQPDAQLVLNPGAGIPGSSGRASLPDALVLGLRLTVKL
jgi:porin